MTADELIEAVSEDRVTICNDGLIHDGEVIARCLGGITGPYSPGELTKTNSYTTMNKNCPDCNAAPGELHKPGCDVERCPWCYQQRWLGCFCREPWSGEWPGESEAAKLGLDLNEFRIRQAMIGEMLRDYRNELAALKPDELQAQYDTRQIHPSQGRDG